MGELNENKNQQVIIRAVAQLKDPKIHYLLCGKGDQREKLESLAKELGIAQHVHFLGYRKDVVDICYQCDVFAHPSRREGLGLAPLEAMYCGLPLVASDTRGIQDYTIPGKSGFLCGSEDVEQFANAIRRLKEDPELRSRCGAYNQKTVQAFCLEQVKEEILSLLLAI